MPPRHLFGPVDQDFAEENLAGVRQAGRCLCFGNAPGVDVALGPNDGWSDLLARLPDGWRPDFLVLQLAYNAVPAALWQAPVPIVALAGDANLQWHSYRGVLPLADLVLADTATAEALRRAGIGLARPALLSGLPHAIAAADWPAVARDIDVLFVGNVHPAVQRERLAWLGRLGRLAPRRTVALRAGLFGAEYRGLLARSRIVFNHTVRGECNRRVFEAVAAGALLFQERGNREVPALLDDRRECVLYGADDLEELLDYYLDHEEERRAIAGAARRKLAQMSFAEQWDEQLRLIEAELPDLRERAGQRVARAFTPSLAGRVWQVAAASSGSDAALVGELEGATRAGPRSSALENALGAALCLHAPHDLGQAARRFHDGWNADPRNVVAGANLSEMLVRLGQRDNAVKQVRRTVAALDEQPGISAAFVDAPLSPAGYDVLRVEWERAGWDHAGRPAEEATAKARLLRWRMHTLLAQLTGELIDYYEAALLRPDLTATRAALGCALGRNGRPADALPHLQTALAGNPFDREAAAALFHTLGLLGCVAEQQRLARTRRALAGAAPGQVPVEEWFAELLPAVTAAGPAEPLRIVWQGSQQALHSLALVNRELCMSLVRRGHELALRPATSADPPGTLLPLPEALRLRQNKALSGPTDVYVRHQWPPDFIPPADGHWVMMQPWEFGSLPRAWLGPMSQLLDEVWVPTRFVRDSFVRCGVPADRVRVVPHGVGPAFFQEAARYPLRTHKTFKFLFVGGTIDRKGIDVLLTAYGQTFSARDDVCLVIKDMGVGTFYQGQTMEARIGQQRNSADAPAIEYLSDPLTTDEMAGLYRACDCLVQPYRGEGFGLPIAEAMACGLPVIVTGYGAALDFCREEWAYLIPARPVLLPEARVDALETVDRPHLAEPDGDALRRLLRHVIEHPAEAKAKAERAREYVRAHLTWEHAASAVERRLQELRRRPIRRLSPISALPAAPAVGRPRISASMIVKNETQNIEACIRSFADLVGEIIVVDTGSTDDTVAIAQRLGAKVFHFPWVDSFAAARNASLRQATGEWVFWMDADDRLDEPNRARLRKLLAELPQENVAYVFKVLCVPRSPGEQGTVVDHVRLFRNLPGLTWEHRIHEQILPSLRRAGAGTVWSDAAIHHVGYQDPRLQPLKLERNLRLLHLEYQEQPNHPYTLFNLGLTYREQGKLAEAADFFRRSLRASLVTDSIVRKLYASIAHCERQLGRAADALTTCRDGRVHYPEDTELLHEESLTLDKLGDKAGAIECLERLLAGRDVDHFASVATGIRGYTTRHQLGLRYMGVGRLAEAEAQWRQALAEQPRYLPAFIGLGDLYVAQSSWPMLDRLLSDMDAQLPGCMPAAVLRGRKHLALKEFAAARDWLGRAIAQHPHEIWPRILYSHVLLQDGSERAAVIQALRDVLALDPNHAESRRSLEALLRDEGEHKHGAA